MRFWKRHFTVSIISPERLISFPHHVRAWDEEDALQSATYYWFQKNWSDRPWYEWRYELLR